MIKSKKIQSGASLIITLIILVVVMGIGVIAVQITTQGEKSTRNDRNFQVAWQAAEAALVDAEFDIRGPGTSTRKNTFKSTNVNNFVQGCGAAGGATWGLCTAVTSGKPAWLDVDFSASNSKSVPFGQFTSRNFESGDAGLKLGLKPVRAPRYLIESIHDIAPLGDASYGAVQKYVYRVSAMGYGPSDNIEAMTQILFRKEDQ